jgi:hypothetical protein
MPEKYSDAVIARFWSKVDQTGDCWLWTGSTSAGRYGSLWDGRRARKAHRVAYELRLGPIPPGLEIDHLCRETFCVRPEHLEAVTHRENMLRGVTAQKTHCTYGHSSWRREARGTRQCRACEQQRGARRKAARHAACRAEGWMPPGRLTDQEVIQLRRDYAAGGVRQVELAERYGVTQGFVSALIRRASRPVLE